MHVVLEEIEASFPGKPLRIRAKVVKIKGELAFVHYAPGGRALSWTMSVDRKTGMPAEGSTWAFRVVKESLPL